MREKEEEKDNEKNGQREVATLTNSYLMVDPNKTSGVLPRLYNYTDYNGFSKPTEDLDVSTGGITPSSVALPDPIVGKHIQLPDGDSTVCALSWAASGEQDSGLNRIGANNYGEYVNGTLVWDWNATLLEFATNYRTYWGTSSSIFPGAQDYLAILYGQNEALRVSLKNTSTGNTAHSTFACMNDTGNDVSVGITNSGFVDTAGLFTAGDGFVGISNPGGSYSGARAFWIYTRFPASIKFVTNNTLKAQITTGGVLLVGTTSASGSEMARINGTIRVDGSGGTNFIGGNITFESTSGMNWDASNNALLIGTASPVATRAQFYVHAAAETRLYARSTGQGAYCMLDRGSTAKDAVVFLTTAGDQSFQWSAGMRGSISTGSDYALHYINVEMWKIDTTGLVTNTSNTTSTTPMHTILQSGTGDAAAKFSIGITNSWAIGADNSDSDKFKISWAGSGSAVLGTNDYFTITVGGVVAFSGSMTISSFLNVGTVTDAAATGDFASGLTGAARIFYDQSVPAEYHYNSLGTIVNQISSVAATATVWNEQGADIDFRIEGDTAANLFFVDASADFIGINTSGPDRRFEILDASNPQLRLTHTDGTVYTDIQVDSGGTCTFTSTNGGFFFTGSGSVNYRVLAATHAYNFIDRGNATTRDALAIYCTNNANIWATGMPGASIGSTSDYVVSDFTGTPVDFMRCISGTGTVFNEGSADLDFRVESNDETHTLFVDGGTNSVRAGRPSLATTATDGFLYVPACGGTPTGAATAVTGMIPIVVDSTNNKLYFYSGGSWRDAGP